MDLVTPAACSLEAMLLEGIEVEALPRFGCVPEMDALVAEHMPFAGGAAGAGLAAVRRLAARVSSVGPETSAETKPGAGDGADAGVQGSGPAPRAAATGSVQGRRAAAAAVLRAASPRASRARFYAKVAAAVAAGGESVAVGMLAAERARTPLDESIVDRVRRAERVSILKRFRTPLLHERAYTATLGRVAAEVARWGEAEWSLFWRALFTVLALGGGLFLCVSVCPCCDVDKRKTARTGGRACELRPPGGGKRDVQRLIGVGGRPMLRLTCRETETETAVIDPPLYYDAAAGKFYEVRAGGFVALLERGPSFVRARCQGCGRAHRLRAGAQMFRCAGCQRVSAVVPDRFYASEPPPPSLPTAPNGAPRTLARGARDGPQAPGPAESAGSAGSAAAHSAAANSSAATWPASADGVRGEAALSEDAAIAAIESMGGDEEEVGAPGSGACGDTKRDVLRSRLISFYNEHNLKKLPLVDDIVDRYIDRESYLWAKIRKKYPGALTAAPPRTPPTEEETDSEQESIGGRSSS
jgi:hypothetical protein